MKLSEYKNLKLGKEQVEPVTDKELEDEMQSVANGKKTATFKQEAAQVGDICNINFEGFLDGKPFEGGKGDNYDLTLGSNTFIPGFEDQLVGHKAGEEVDVNVSFPDNYPALELQGKPVVFKCKIIEVKQYVVPAIDDNLAKAYGCKDLKDLKDKIRSDMNRRKLQKAEDDYLAKVCEYLVNKSEVEVTEEDISKTVATMFKEFENQLASQGATLDDYLKYVKATKEDLEKQYKEQAVVIVKREKIFAEIEKLENFTASDEEIDNQIKSYANYYHLDEEQVKKLKETSSKDFSKFIIRTKVLNMLINENN